MQSVTEFTYWVIWLLLILFSIYHRRVKSTPFLIPQLLILTIRMLVGIIDLDQKRKELEDYEIVCFLLFQANCISYLQINLSQLLSFRKNMVVTFFVSDQAGFTGLGIITMTLKYPEDLMDGIRIIFTNSRIFKSFMQYLVLIFAGFNLFFYFLNQTQFQLLKS